MVLSRLICNSFSLRSYLRDRLSHILFTGWPVTLTFAHCVSPLIRASAKCLNLYTIKDIWTFLCLTGSTTRSTWWAWSTATPWTRPSSMTTRSCWWPATATRWTCPRGRTRRTLCTPCDCSRWDWQHVTSGLGLHGYRYNVNLDFSSLRIEIYDSSCSVLSVMSLNWQNMVL